MSALSVIVLALSGGAIGVGLLLMAGGALGMLRFPDFYTRLHAQRTADAVGAAFVLLGLAIAADDAQMLIKLSLLAVLLIAAAPTLAHFTANAAHAGGLAPLSGPAAPRRGEPSP